ncbi:tetratricopeptide repeat protein [Micromonospora sp. DT229]|uniref:tetratricopeptide repeat protein n=1 Tax=Micromonospora sp. DT229 TaxID=3393430 RepID=UPI003CE84D74
MSSDFMVTESVTQSAARSELRRLLRDLVTETGKSLRTVAKENEGNPGLSSSNISRYLGDSASSNIPRRFVVAIAAACGASKDEEEALLTVWRRTWRSDADRAEPGRDTDKAEPGQDTHEAGPDWDTGEDAVQSSPPPDPEHLRTIELMVSVAHSLDEANGGLHAARRLYERARAARSALLGPDAPATLVAAHNLGTVLAQLGEARAACVILSETYEARRRTLGPDAPATLKTLDHFATAKAGMGEFETAIELLERSLSARRPKSSPGHLQYADTVIRLLAVSKRADDHERVRKLSKELESIRREDPPRQAGNPTDDQQP